MLVATMAISCMGPEHDSMTHCYSMHIILTAYNACSLLYQLVYVLYRSGETDIKIVVDWFLLSHSTESVA